jgi:hypothetical protein
MVDLKAVSKAVQRAEKTAVSTVDWSVVSRANLLAVWKAAW